MITDFTAAVAYTMLKYLRLNTKSVHCNKRDHEAGRHEAEAVVSGGRGRSEDLTSVAPRH